MKKLKLNEPMAELFFSGCFGEIYIRELIESYLKIMNKSNATEMKFESGFFDKHTMKHEANDVEITVTLTIRKLEE